MERHRAEGYAVGGWRSAALEVGGIGMRADDRGQRTEIEGRTQRTEGRRHREDFRLEIGDFW